jgi:hypothetical protein
MTSKNKQQSRPANLRSILPEWGDTYDEFHRWTPPKGSNLVYAGDVPLGMFDQEDLYPHLITEARGVRVAVPLGACGEGDDEEYEVEQFFYQFLPQKEMHWGWGFPIHRVKLSGVLRPNGHLFPGMIRTIADGGLELCCSSPRGVWEWLPLPGCTTRKPAGKIYEKWEIFVELDGRVRCMVRFDGHEFQHWPEDSVD